MSEQWNEASVPTHKIHGGKWVKVVAHIRLNASGEIRKHESEEILMDDEDTPGVFNWEENNFSCDCNRELFFGYAGGLKAEQIVETCGRGRFSVNLENPVTGTIYYREFA